MDQPEICGKAASVLVSALKEIYEETPSLRNSAKPSLTFVSTTGITTGPADVPWSMRFLYHVILATPHVDKKKMEDVYREGKWAIVCECDWDPADVVDGWD